MALSLGSIRALLCAATFAIIFSTCSALKLAITEPDLRPVVSGAGLPHYSVGDNVTIKWTTPFRDTTLLVYQSRGDNSVYKVLAGMHT